MQALQERLLGLLKEIDAVCEEHGITYYCSGGTVIGAARHGGFIPWDDDIDVCMMRDDFERFREVMRSNSPEGRCLLCSEDYPDYHSTIPRYVEYDSTSFCRYHLLGKVPAGVSIDIFILEPVPSDTSAQRDFIRRFFNYSDLVMPFYCFSHRVPSDHLDDMAGYINECRRDGEATVIERLHDELFGMSDPDSEYVCLLWASSPSIFPKRIFGKPARVRFEDAEICVPGDWYSYLVLEYGMDWNKVPYSESHDEHITINRLDEPYSRCYEIRDSLYEQEDLRRLFFDRKTANIEYERRHRALLDARCRVKAEAVTAAMHNRLEVGGIELTELYAEGRTDSILDIFAPLLETQLSRWLIGSRTRFHYYRYMYPVIIELSEQERDILLKSLLRAGRLSNLKKLLDIYERAGIRSEAAAYAAGALSYIQRAEAAYYYGKPAECIEACAACPYEEASERMNELRALCMAVTEPETVISELENGHYEAGSPYMKALADAYFNTGRKDDAISSYRLILEGSRDGMMWKDIKERTGMDSASINNSAPYAPDRLIRLEKQLLDELTGLCADHGIEYVLSPETAESLVEHGDLGYKADRKILYMTIENARALIGECGASLPAGRCLRSRNNDSRIMDLVLEYSIADSVSVNLRKISTTISGGIGITIRILRNGSPYSPVNIVMRLLEQRGDYDFAMKHGSGKAGGSYYYYVNKPGSRPVRRLVKASVVDDAAVISCGGRDYRIPASVLNKADKKTGTDKTSIPENIFCSEYLSFDEFLDIADRSGIRDIDMADHDFYAGLSKAADAAVDDVWNSIVLRESGSKRS